MKLRFLLFSLICLTSIEAQYYSECVRIENDLQYMQQRSCISDTEVNGYVEGGRLTHHYLYGRLGFTDRLYAGHGVLTGEDAFDDDVKIQYTEYDGEFWITYLFQYNRMIFTPFIGWGIRQHRNKKTAPVDLSLETTYQYLPMGIRLNVPFGMALNLGIYFKTEIMTYTDWKFHHPLICSESRELETYPGFEGKAWASYFMTPCWKGVFGVSFRYLKLQYPDDISFAPEPKEYLNYGFQAGLEYLF